jgi:membrane protein
VDFIRRVRARIAHHNASMLAAGVAFYALMALFPTLIAVVAVWALGADPAQVSSQLAPLARHLPADVGQLLTDQLTDAVHANRGGVTVGLVASLLGAVWAASGGVNGLTRGLTIIFDTSGQRKMLRQRAVSLALTLGALLVVVLALALVAVFPVVLDHLGLGTGAKVGAQVLRWLLLFVVVAAGLATLYRIAGTPADDGFLFVSFGVLVAVVVWIAGSVGLSLYVANFGHYNRTYGSLASVIVLLLWLYLSAFAVLLGAVVDAELAAPRAKRLAAEKDAVTGAPAADAPDAG